MALRLIAVGRTGRDPLRQEAEAYLERAARHLRIDVRDIAPARRGKGPEEATLRAEAKRILEQARGCRLVLLDAGGPALSSEAFAAQLERWLVAGDLAIVIGGATGLHPSVRAQADALLSLGPMTLPHRLARLVLCEQIYRATAIWHGEPYHK